MSDAGLKVAKRDRSKVTYAVLNTKEVSMRESKRSIGANFMHSRDADHAHHIIYMCKQEGIDDLTHIHDCFGTHLCDMDRLNRIIRETFVDLYGGQWCAFKR